MKKINDIKTTLSGYTLAGFCIVNGILIKLGYEDSEWIAWIVVGIGLGVLGYFTKDKHEIHNRKCVGNGEN